MGKYKFEYKHRRELKHLYTKMPFLKKPFDKVFNIKNVIAPHYKLPLLIIFFGMIYLSYNHVLKLGSLQYVKNNYEVQKFVFYLCFLVFVPVVIKTVITVGRTVFTNSKTGELKKVESK